MQTSPLLADHRARNATLSAAPSPFVLTFGEVPDEYRAAREHAVVFDRSERGCVEVRGADAVAFLHRLTANEVRKLAPGNGSRNLLLSSKGKVLFDFDLSMERDCVRLSTVPGQAAALLAALDVYLFSEKVTFADVSEQHAPLDVCGPSARAHVEKLAGVRAPERDHDWIDAEFGGGALRISAQPVAGSPGFRLDAGPERAAALWGALLQAGVVPAGRVTYDILRVEAGWAEPGVDIGESVYPQEARLERAFGLDKGCYIGQEVVAKIDTYGGLNKRLVALAVDHDNPVAGGARLWRNDEGEWRDLGVCTSWAYSFVLDTGSMLAYVKRRHQALGAEFVIGSPEQPQGRARIVALPIRPDAVKVTGEFE